MLNLTPNFAEDLEAVLNKEIGSSRENCYFQGYTYQEMLALTQEIPESLDILTANGFCSHPMAGRHRMVVMHESNDWVLKIPFRRYQGDETPDHPATRELKLLGILQDKLPELFPVTHDIGKGMLLQESCPVDIQKAGKWYGKIALIFRLLHIDDFVHANVGWKDDLPLIIDFASYADRALEVSQERIEQTREILAGIKPQRLRIL